jgi:hypothetical protein
VTAEARLDDSYAPIGSVAFVLTFRGGQQAGSVAGWELATARPGLVGEAANFRGSVARVGVPLGGPG